MKRNPAIEGLRGIAALVVFYHHLIIGNIRGWSPSRWAAWPVEASAAVMVFFVLSGYVIGLNHHGEATLPAIRKYAWRRALRLTPINCVAVLLGCVAATEWDILSVLSNLLFLENTVPYGSFWLPALATNGNLWSLNHEVVYYSLFVAVWLWRPRLKYVAILALITVFGGWFTAWVPLFVACYAAGFLFWITGLGIARYSEPKVDERAAWPSYALLALITWKVQPLFIFLSGRMPLPSFAGATVKLYYLTFLPCAALLVATVAGRTFSLMPLTKFLAWTMPLVGFALLLLTKDSPSLDLQLTVSVYILALVLARWRPSLSFFRFCAPAGAVSFALYATARPIQIYVFDHAGYLPSNGTGFVVCAITIAVVAWVTAWYLEVRIQPEIQRRVASLEARKEQHNGITEVENQFPSSRDDGSMIPSSRRQ